MSLDIWAAATALFVASFTPGPNNAICASIGATYGYTRALPFALGVTVGYPALIAAVGLGLAGLLAAFPQLHLAIKICGASFLLYLAWKIATAKNTPATNAKVPGFWRAFLFQWFNPKGVLGIIQYHRRLRRRRRYTVSRHCGFDGYQRRDGVWRNLHLGFGRVGHFPIVEFPTRIGDLQRRNGRTACAVANSGVFINDPQNVR